MVAPRCDWGDFFAVYISRLLGKMYVRDLLFAFLFRNRSPYDRYDSVRSGPLNSVAQNCLAQEESLTPAYIG